MNGPARSNVFDWHVVLPNRREEMRQAEQVLLREVEERFDKTSCFAIRLALEEALGNAFKHGNREDPNKTVTIEATVASDEVQISIEDQGKGFDPDTIPDPTAEENLEIPSGRGLVLIKAFMTEVTVHPPGNRLQMRYVRPGRTDQ